ncbi:MAG: UGSC family (seleno)protein [Nostocoides sp.]
MATIDIMVPELADEPPPSDLRLAERRPLPDHARLTLVDNGKPKAAQLLSMIAEGLRHSHGISSVELYAKGSASRVLDDDEVASIAVSSDVAITGLGDCGACSACSLGDAIKMEAAGIPSTVLISDVFTGHVASFAVTMGMPGYHFAVVPHPVSSKDDGQLASYAAAVLDQVAFQLTGALATQPQLT